MINIYTVFDMLIIIILFYTMCSYNDYNTKYRFNIVSDTDTDEKFMDMYQDVSQLILKNKGSHDNPIDLTSDNVDTMYEIMKGVIDNSIWKRVLEEDPGNYYFHNRYSVPVKLGDTVNVSYIPASQRYIDHYEELSFTGTIFFVDNEHDNMFLFFENEDNEIEVRSLEVEWCSYYGTSRGYDYFIDSIDS